MVRRRTRATKITGLPVVGNVGEGAVVTMELLSNGLNCGAVASTLSNGNMLDDQYFASPKRKDCKIDCGEGATAVLNNDDVDLEEKVGTKSLSPAKSRSERSGIAGRPIGVPLATRSQTRTIENYFKAKKAAKSVELKTTETYYQPNATEPTNSNNNEGIIDSSNNLVIRIAADTEVRHDDQSSQSPTLQSHTVVDVSNMQPDFFFDLSEDTNDTDNTELSDEYSAVSGTSAANAPQNTMSLFDIHRSPMRDSHSSRGSTTENIFLQEPVLTLNVDKSPNQASSIKINKSLEVEPIFSSPPTAITAAVLNGRFTQIVTLHGGSPAKRDSFGFETQPITIASQCYALSLDQDNSSCDSGVAFVSSTSLDNNSPHPAAIVAPTRRRKPATPHRIVCPSPIKAAPRIVSPSGGGTAAGNVGSPSTRKIGASKEQLSPRKSQRYLSTAPNSKTRRRLNQPKEHQHQAPYQTIIMQNGYKQNVQLDGPPHHHHILDDEADDDQEFENLEDAAAAVAVAFYQAPPSKLIINPTTAHSTAQQQHSINKSHKPSRPTGGKVQHQQQQPKIKSHHRQHQAPLPLAATNDNRDIGDFFPVRRSVRKTKTAVKEEMMRNLEQAILEERAEGLKVAHFENKGRGIVADRHFQRGEFVVEYVGDLISMTEAAEREKRYALDENAGCYMYYFKHKNQQYCIDATSDTGKLGRLVNHSRTGNLVTKVVVIKQRPHLILIAKDDIESGEELTYDYGDRSKESLMHHPWLAF